MIKKDRPAFDFADLQAKKTTSKNLWFNRFNDIGYIKTISQANQLTPSHWVLDLCTESKKKVLTTVIWEGAETLCNCPDGFLLAEIRSCLVFFVNLLCSIG